MREPMILEDFAAKCEWEGGIVGGLDYGLTPDDAPEGELRDLWKQAYDLYEQIRPITAKIAEYFENAGV